MIIITLLYCAYNYLRDDYIMEILRDHKVQCLKTITPNYPPPLTNFGSRNINVRNIV